MSAQLSPIVSEFETEEQAASYDRWFRAKVQESIDGLADGSNKPYTPEEWAVRRAEIIARFSGRKAA